MSSVLIQSFGDFLRLLVQAFNLSSAFPALIFVILTHRFVFPLLPTNSPFRFATESATTPVGLTILFVALIAYLLDAANFPIIRLLEGYWFRNWPLLSRWQKANQSYVSRTQASIKKLEKSIDELIEQANQDKTWHELGDLIGELIKRKRKLIQEIARKYPDPSYVLPTPFGNVIAAAEQYPRKTFGMNSVVLWPFLIPILTRKNYAQFVVRAKAVMDFFINLTVVLGVFGFLLGISEWSTNGVSWALVFKLSLVALSCLGTYFLSIWGAVSWGTTFRSAFVIFREDLRRTLRLRRPQNYLEERKLWKTASDFFRTESFYRQEEWGQFIFDASSYELLDTNEE